MIAVVLMEVLPQNSYGEIMILKVMSSWGGALGKWLGLIKETSGANPFTTRVRTQQEVCDPEEGPHLNMN